MSQAFKRSDNSHGGVCKCGYGRMLVGGVIIILILLIENECWTITISTCTRQSTSLDFSQIVKMAISYIKGTDIDKPFKGSAATKLLVGKNKKGDRNQRMIKAGNQNERKQTR